MEGENVATGIYGGRRSELGRGRYVTGAFLSLKRSCNAGRHGARGEVIGTDRDRGLTVFGNVVICGEIDGFGARDVVPLTGRK